MHSLDGGGILRRLLNWMRSVHIATLVGVMALLAASGALAEKGKLLERLTPEVMRVVYPGGYDRLGPEEGSPPAIAVYKDDKIVAYVFSTLDIINAPGYSTTPFDVIGGVDLSGRITGSKVVFHHEPYILHDPKRQRQLDELLTKESGMPLRGTPDQLPPDYVNGATVSTRAMRAGVRTTAGLVLRPRSGQANVTVPTLDIDTFGIKSQDDLFAEGSVVRRRVNSSEITEALKNTGVANPRLDVGPGRPDDLYVEFVTALVTPPTIGGNLLGLLKFEDYKKQLPNGAQGIFIASGGRYDFLGTKYFRESEGNRFDRIRVVQDERTFEFVQNDYTYAASFKGYDNAGLFSIPAGSGFDPVKPWRLELLVNGTGVRGAPLSIPLALEYKVPAQYVLLPPEPEPPPVPAWVEAWHDSQTNVVILGVLLSVLTLIFVFQTQLVRYRLAHKLVRNGFLLVVLVWLGWTAGVQLSIVNVMNYVRAPFLNLDFGTYLAEPLMLIVAVYTLISVLLIGRGVFCGWLCPFGAMQELLGQISRALHVPQWNPAPALEKRLWMGKYIAAVLVLVLVMSEIDATGVTAEIEPFKTAITSKFTRAWPFVIYAVGLLAIGLFSERAYCRFLCPLGGVLAFLDRLHLLNLLKRRPECGSPCHLCERSCPVRAIDKTGKIVTAECFQCLDCQVEYYDDKRCPPLVQAAKLRATAKPAAVAAN